ncbi:hypothetical protein CYMTET_39231 [Cymbomonas tetramitiformis]|uniref:RING-type domain-containing protein n=1 Tax=Cymbomonas tetramitiformis TaxID=36881 RepID=A0AAE0CAG1_9CHLO|nr:hypothetical protein CYMTET_39231 [Cymbomonas tetramitiformis]
MFGLESGGAYAQRAERSLVPVPDCALCEQRSPWCQCQIVPPASSARQQTLDRSVAAVQWHPVHKLRSQHHLCASVVSAVLSGWCDGRMQGADLLASRAAESLLDTCLVSWLGPVVAEQNPLEADQASTPQTDAPIATLPVKKELDPSLECVICRGLLAVACSLACGHVFCWVCCDGWRAAKRDKPEGALCPTCRGSMTTSGRCVPLDHLAETMARDVLKDDPGELQEWEERKREGLERARRAQAEAVAKARAAEDDGVSDDEGSEDDNSEDNDDDDDEDGDESSDEDSLGSNEGSGDEDDEEDTSQEDRRTQQRVRGRAAVSHSITSLLSRARATLTASGQRLSRLPQQLRPPHLPQTPRQPSIARRPTQGKPWGISPKKRALKRLFRSRRMAAFDVLLQ